MRYTPRPDCQIPTLGQIYEAHLPLDADRFVEIGAYDGVKFSNTVMLAEAGWEGLYVEPHPQFAAECRENHKGHSRISVAQTAISDFEGQTELFLIGECSSIVWDQNAVDWGGKQDKKIAVPVTTLDRLLERRQVAPKFNLLVIDVEQNELNVLKGFTIGNWQPGMVIIEAHEKDAAAIRNHKAFPISQYFDVNGYRKVYADHINTIFVRG